MTAVEICPICDIAGCRHIRESKAKMTRPNDEELDALVERAMVIDPLLEVDFNTQRDVEQDPYGAREAIETALYLIRDQDSAIATLRTQLAEVQAERDAWRDQCRDPLLGSFAKALEDHRESIPVAIWSHIDALQKQIDYSANGKFGPVYSGPMVDAAFARADRAEAALAEIKQTLGAPDDWHPVYAVKALKQSNDRAEDALAAQIEVDLAKNWPHTNEGLLPNLGLQPGDRVVRVTGHDKWSDPDIGSEYTFCINSNSGG